jgi:8-oxo-dGTP diphosphatase
MRPKEHKPGAALNAMQKAGAVIIQDRKVMVVRKKSEQQAECIMPGGKIEEGETHYECLVRELAEELEVGVLGHEYIGSYQDIAVFEGVPLVVHAYRVDITGKPRPSSEIKEYLWVDSSFRDHGIKIGSIMARQIMPEMRKRGLID